MNEGRRKEYGEECLSRSIALPYLKELRQLRGLGQRDLGRLAEVSPTTVRLLETGQRGAYPHTVRKLASALEVSPAELVRERRPQ
jgi:transcriptional regulator with XRE-family HTH domain